MNLSSKEKLSKLVLDLRGTKSRRSLAKVIGVTATAVIAWENAVSLPDTEHLSKIANLAGYSFEELLDYLEIGDNKKSKKKSLPRLIADTASLSPSELIELYEVISGKLIELAKSAS